MTSLIQNIVFSIGLLGPSGNPVHSSYQWLDAGSIQEADSLKHRIPAPEGFRRIETKPNSFARWLRNLPLKKAGSPVRAFDGRVLRSPAAAVVNLDVGKRDLQQCADSLMRLRAEYLFSQKRHDDIVFQLTNGMDVRFSKFAAGYKLKQISRTRVDWVPRGQKGASHSALRQYLKQVYLWAGTASLQHESQHIPLSDLQPGDFFIQGGFPGHTVIVLDIAENASGERRLLLGQGFMPAQDFHVVPNARGEPWHVLQRNHVQIQIPAWPHSFGEKDLYRFEH